MTKPQRDGYWSRWSQACRAHNWQSSDTLRYEMHRRALGNNKSSTRFTQRDVDRVYAYCEVLASGLGWEEADAMFELKVVEKERNRLIRGIEQRVGEDYAMRCASDKFGAKYGRDQFGSLRIDWRRIDIKDMKHLHWTICNRMNGSNSGQSLDGQDEPPI